MVAVSYLVFLALAALLIVSPVIAHTRSCTEHQAQARADTDSGMDGVFIPDCNEAGKYAKIQRHGSTGLSWCADEGGNQIGDRIRGEPNC